MRRRLVPGGRLRWPEGRDPWNDCAGPHGLYARGAQSREKGMEERPKSHHELVLERQATWNTPREVIERAVAAAGCGAVARIERLYGGEANEVHAVGDSAGRALVVRIAHRQHPWFGGEAWALERCRLAGLPVPEVLHLEHVESAGEVLSICVQRMLPGRQMPADATADLVREAGELLARLHRVEVPGFGHPDADGRFPARALDEVVLERAEARAVPRALDAGLPRDLADAALAHLRRHRAVIAAARPHLVHGDYGLKHLLVEDGRITGILDFENCRGGDPAEDFAWWDFFYDRAPHGSALMLEGYRRVADPGAALDLRRRLFRLALGLNTFSYYTQMGSAGLAEMSRRNIERDVAWLAAHAPAERSE